MIEEYILITVIIALIWWYASYEEKKQDNNNYTISEPSNANSMIDDYNVKLNSIDPVSNEFRNKFFNGPIGEYRSYLKSEKWKFMRMYVFQLADYKCEHCGVEITETSGHCHHITYERVFHEEPHDLIALCKHCHFEEHKRLDAERNSTSSTSNQTNYSPISNVGGF